MTAATAVPISTSSNSAQPSGNAERYVRQLSSAVEDAVKEIRRINENTRMLALNARIEAARAGSFGPAFGVVASEMQELSTKTTAVANGLANVTKQNIVDLIDLISTQIRVTKLGSIALTNIELIDRCLYERTCDVRWWATDSSLTRALESRSVEDVEYAIRRLGVILDSYTVYFDLVVCDSSGNVVANGRPTQFNSIGKNADRYEWFRQAIRSSTGSYFGFQPDLCCDLVSSQPAMIYSCSIREGGAATGKTIGALGVLFDWHSFAVPILANIPIEESDRECTQSLIIDSNGTVIASDSGCEINSTFQVPECSRVFAKDRGHYIAEKNGSRYLITHAKAPGFETYSTGWFSVIMQRL